MSFERNEEKAKAVEALVAFLEGQPDGARLSWLEIETATSVPMTGPRRDSGRAWFRDALKKAKRAHVPLSGGLGVELSAPGNATAIAAHRTKRIVGEAKVAHRSATVMLDRHAEALPPAEREMLRANRSLTGVLVEMGKGATKSIKQSPEPSLPRLPK